MPKILFLNSPKNDFLADSFLIGLKTLYPNSVWEWPKNQFIYTKEQQEDSRRMHGIGFTLYNLLHPENALEFKDGMDVSGFDLIIFGDIYRQATQFLKLWPHLNVRNTIILDGEDTAATFPYYFAPWKKPYSLFFPKPEKTFHYFKREIIPARTNYYRFFKLIPKSLAARIALHQNILPISFSIPNEKILVGDGPEKQKDFGRHIVDPEVCQNVPGAVSSYAFSMEEDYYHDLQISRFGITMKRGGWDCLRHYEIAANGAVPCFRNLEDKPINCAPHGLVPGKNCISYQNWNDLQSKIAKINPAEYAQLRKEVLNWANEMECSRLVKRTLDLHASRI